MLTPTSLLRFKEFDEPLHGQVSRLLAEHIETQCVNGERFYTDRELISMLEVSQPTIRRAVQVLVERGLLERHVGRGTFVQKTKPDRLLGIFMPDNPSPLFMAMLEGFAALSGEFDYKLDLHYLNKGETAKRACAGLRKAPEVQRWVLLGNAIDVTWNLFEELDKRGYRTVLSGPFPPGYPGSYVSIDNDAAVQMGVDHLIGLGHERIVFLVNEPKELANVKLRVEAVERTITARGLKQAWIHDCQTPNWSNAFEAALQAMPAVLARQPTAIFTISTMGAWAVVNYANRHRIDIPAQFSVLGVDNVACSDLLNPALTTIGFEPRFFARRVLDRLWSDVSDVHHDLITPSLFLRASTGYPQVLA